VELLCRIRADAADQRSYGWSCFAASDERQGILEILCDLSVFAVNLTEKGFCNDGKRRI